jgi:tetratricopeptide (TPR) repeat protein
VGWHCWASNVPSAATALRAGFAKVCDYTVYFAWYDAIDNLVVNGNMHFDCAQYEEALGWYERAFARGEAKGWGYWNAACAAAELGQHDVAMRYLTHAIDKGFGDAQRLSNSEHLKSLRARPEWDALLRRQKSDF